MIIMLTVWLVVAKVGIVAALGAAATLAGGRLVLAVFRRVDTSQPRHGQPSLIAAGERLRGGVWIGILERLSIFATLLAHYPDGVAVVLAIKALARYPELKAPDSGTAERFIIGTLVSVLVACAAAGLAHWLIGLF